MLIFLDTEFTSLARDRKLISVGMVGEDGHDRFYAEIPRGDGWTTNDCNAFVKKIVLPLLDGGEFEIARADLSQALAQWFATLPRSVTIACDSVVDWQMISPYLQPYPANLTDQYKIVATCRDTMVGDKAINDYYLAGGREHHALDDAQALRLAHAAWQVSRS